MAAYFLSSTLLLWRQEKREQFPSWFAIFTIILSTIFELAIYWFTSQALGANLENFGNYFQFVVTGQIVLFIPLHLLRAFSMGVREARAFGTLDAILILPTGLAKKVFLCAWGPILRNFFHLFLFVFFAVVIFGYRLELHIWTWLVLYQILFLPLFTALGLIAAGLYFFFGRGIGFFQMITQAIALLSGVYFPIHLFPALNSVSLLSPFHLILELSRNPNALSGLAWLILGSWTILTVALTPFALRLGYTSMRRRGKLEFSHLA